VAGNATFLLSFPGRILLRYAETAGGISVDYGNLKTLFNESAVSKLLGIEISEISKGMVRGTLKLRKKHMNPSGGAHGGILFTFADHVGGACSKTMGKWTILVESSIQYLKGPSIGDTVFAEARLVHAGRRIGRVDVQIVDKNQDLLALAHQIFYVRDIRGDEQKPKTPDHL
jgi:acyl-CoA thioesterase